MISGKHLIVDVYLNKTEDSVLLNSIETIRPLMMRIIEVGCLTVVGEMKHQFNPIGATLLFLLSESHLSIHTYPERSYCAIDLYCCNPDINFNLILETIYNFFNNDCIITKKIIDR